ncbi:hypothetical protein K4L05_20010 (plasmid) [Phaeobacter inhibens]|nr:hypothetical protein K4L05_20010 [Phaeobacter inhibens]
MRCWCPVRRPVLPGRAGFASCPARLDDRGAGVCHSCDQGGRCAAPKPAVVAHPDIWPERDRAMLRASFHPRHLTSALRQYRRNVPLLPVVVCIALGLAIGVSPASRAGAGVDDIQPRDGHWLALMQFRSVSGCSATLRREIEADAEDELLYSKPLTFSTPLDLNHLNAAWEVDIDWTRTSPNRWEGVMTEVERTLFGKVTTVTALKTRVISEGLIDQKAVATITFPPRIARQIGTAEPCVVHADITHRRR